MSVNNTSGKSYDIEEMDRMNQFFDELEADFKKIEAEKLIQNKKILQYVLVLTGVVLSIYTFSVLVNKRK